MTALRLPVPDHTSVRIGGDDADPRVTMKGRVAAAARASFLSYAQLTECGAFVCGPSLPIFKRPSVA